MSPTTWPSLTGDPARRLREALQRAGYTTTGVVELLGDAAHAALGRHDPVPARRASVAGGDLGTLVRLFLCGDPEPAPAVARALAPLSPATAEAVGVLVRDGGVHRAALDVRPHGDAAGDWWVVSDRDVPTGDRPTGAPGPDHVIGVGQASLSLVRATARRPVGTLLDLGTGCGIQALHASRHAGAVTATDVAPRALAMAAATFALNELDVELRGGEWFDPVGRRRFDQVVSNPPFVVGPPRVEHVYRDSGLGGDAASELVVRALPEHLAAGGTGQLLASWLHVRGQDWADRVASWLPHDGVDAWVVQRDVADPARYVGTWLADAGVPARSPQARQRTEEWLDWFAAHDVAGVGFGYVSVRNSGAARSTVVCEDLRHAFDDPLGPEAAAWLDRAAWLRAHDDDALLGTALTLAPDTVLDRRDTPGPTGWTTLRAAVRRTTGPGCHHEVDERAVALLAGCTGALPLGDLVGLLAAAHGEPAGPLVAAALPAVRDLVQRGLLLP